VKRRGFLWQASLAALSPALVPAQKAQSERDRWVAKAEALKPRLRAVSKRPVRLVNPVSDTTRFFQWRMEEAGAAAGLRDRLMGKHDSAVLDFGEHLTGHWSGPHF